MLCTYIMQSAQHIKDELLFFKFVYIFLFILSAVIVSKTLFTFVLSFILHSCIIQ